MGIGYVDRAHGINTRQFPIYRNIRKAICIFFHGRMFNHDVTIKGIPEGRPHRYIVYHPYYQQWVVAFVSYDGRGIVIKNPYYGIWQFVHVYSAVYDIPRSTRGKALDTVLDALFWTKHDMMVKKAEEGQYPYYMLKKAKETEERAFDYLEAHLPDNYFVYLLPNSGYKMGGDIFIIPKHKVSSSTIEPHYRLKMLKDSHISIEVLGANMYYGKLRLNHKHKNFLKWVQIMEATNTLPVIMFYEENTPHFLICNEAIVRELFFKKNGQPRTTYTKVEALKPYLKSIEQVLYYRKKNSDKYHD